MILNTMHTPVLFSVFVLLTTFLILWKRWRLYYVSYQLKGPFALPGIGNYLDIIKNSEDLLVKFIQDRKKYGCPYRIWFGTKLFVYISNPEDFKVLFNNPYALNKKEIYVFYKVLSKEGLFSCSDVSKWRKNRKIIARMFNQGVLNEFIPVFQEKSLILSKKLDKMVGKGSFDIHSWLSRCHVDMIFETTTGVKVNVQEGESEYMKCFDRLCDIMYTRMLNVLLYPDFIYKRTTVGKKEKELSDYIFNFNKNVIYSKRKPCEQSSQDENPKKSKVALDYLIKSGQFTNYELEAELVTLIVGGSDTGSTSESFTLMLLGMHQAVQDKVFQEQKEIFGDNQREITYADLSEMNYLERVIKESMRIFPVAGMIFRTVTNDVQLSTCTLPKDTTVILGVLDAHRNPNLWKDPLKFDPDRFLSERIAKQHQYSYIPFSSGPRDCIGQRYGMMAMKVILSTIVRKYRIYYEYKSVEDIKVFQHFTLGAKDGFQISLEARN